MNLRGPCVWVVSLFGLIACSSPMEPPSKVDVGGTTLSLSVTASGNEIVGSSPVTFTIRLLNEGAQSVTLHFGSGCQISPYIRASSGAVVLPSGGGWGCTTALTQLSLAAGESVVREYVWTGSTEFQSEMPLRPLPKGRYFFSAVVPSGEAMLRSRAVEVVVR
jgi:hypothetical protein